MTEKNENTNNFLLQTNYVLLLILISKLTDLEDITRSLIREIRENSCEESCNYFDFYLN